MAGKVADKKALRSPQAESIRLLAVVALIIIAMAAALVLVSPRGSDLSRCNAVLLAGNKEQCLYSLATLSQNASICGSLQYSYADSCYIAIAEKSYNASMCYRTNDSNSTAACVGYIANATGSFSACYGLQGAYRDGCISAIALGSRNATLCSQVSNGANRTVCQSSIAYRDALAERNPAACSNVTATENASVVSSIVYGSGVLNYSKAYQNISAYLTLIAFTNSSSLTSRDFCYLSYATQFSNSSACADLSNQTVQQACAASVESSASAVPSANAINYTQLRAECTNSTVNSSYQATCTTLVDIAQAVKTRNLSICSSLNMTSSWDCYSSLASWYLNATYCGYIRNETVSNACTQSVYYNLTNETQGTAATGTAP